MSEHSDPKTEDLVQRVSLVINDCIRRRADGEVIPDELLIGAHPDLMPELAEQLCRLRLIEKVQRQFDDEQTNASHDPCIRCPHCHNPVALADDTRLSHVVCSACGSAFGLVDDLAEQGQLAQVGHFKLLDRLGMGSFGTVWSAYDTELDRQVAVKIPRKGQISGEDAEKIVREARAAAQLSHPNIVQVHEVGREGDRLYIVTDFVQGRDLADWLTDQRATPREAAELCAALADAVDHAHQRGVIHRDLKPSNIVIDSERAPHLMDFGLAKREAGEVTMTVDGKLLGTPAYMSPEQARGAAHEVGGRSDIYSLGVILSELLTGERPFRGNTRMLLHQILVDDPTGPRKLNSRIPRELETICLKCLEKSVDRRYQTARELADDLRRFLRGEPIRARPISSVARTWRWATRNPWLAVSAATAAGLLLLLGVAGPLVAIHQTAQAELYRWRSYASDMKLASQRWESADVQQVVDLLNRHMPRSGQKDLRGFEWYYLWRRCRPSETTKTIPYDAPGHIAFSPDGKTLAVAGSRTLMLWDLTNDKEILKFEAHTDIVKGVAFSPDGQTLATGGWDGALKLWHLAQDHERALLSEPTVLTTDENMTYHDVAFSPDGKLLATNGDKMVPIWDVEQRRLMSELEGHEDEVMCVAFSTNGTLATGSADKTVRLWDLTNGQQIVTLGRAELDRHEGSVDTVAFSPDGMLLASGSSDDTVKLWDIGTGALQTTLEGHSNEVRSVAFSLDGHTLASASSDGMVKLWNMQQTKAEPATLKGHAGDVVHLAFSPDGEMLASVGTAGGVVRLWDLTLLQRETFTGRRVPWDARGEALMWWTSQGLPQLCDDSAGQAKRAPPSPGTVCMADSPDGTSFAAGNADGTVELHRLGSGEKHVFPDQHNGHVAHVLFSPDGKTLVSVGGPLREQVLKLWNVGSGKVLADMDVSWTAYPVFSHDSNVLATVNEDRPARAYSIKLWRWTGEHLATITDEQDLPYFSLAFSAGGKMLAAGSVFGEITVWDVKSGEQLRESFRAHTSNVYGLAFSPGNKRLASCSYDRTVKLWDLSTGDEMITLKGHRRSVWSVGFSPDGSTLASASEDGVVKPVVTALKDWW